MDRSEAQPRLQWGLCIEDRIYFRSGEARALDFALGRAVLYDARPIFYTAWHGTLSSEMHSSSSACWPGRWNLPTSKGGMLTSPLGVLLPLCFQEI